jgi:TonB family protein
MSQDPQSVSSSPASVAPRLLTELEPWHRVFFRNFFDLFRSQPPVRITARPAPFWPDVFVTFPLPRRGLIQSALWHTLAAVMVYAVTVVWLAPPPARTSFFKNAQITYYSVGDYLPPIDSGSEPAPKARKGEPAFARQKVLSLPKSPDNSRQTIIDPSTVRILHDPKAMPNLVAWTPIPSPVPISGASRSAAQISLPAIDMSVIGPTVQDVKRDVRQMKISPNAPDVIPPPVQDTKRDVAKLNLPAFAPGVVEPTPSADAAKRNIGDINMARMQSGVAAPKLPVAEQRSIGVGEAGGASASNTGNTSGANIPPAPSAAGTGAVGPAAGRLIALGLDPVAASGPIEMPGGNRRGIFAAGPEGKPGAPGTPDIAGGGKGPGGQGTGDAGAGKGGPADIPSGITIGSGPANQLAAMVATSNANLNPAPNANPTAEASRTAAPRKAEPPKLLASVTPPRVGDIARQTGPSHPEGKVEDQVFGVKKYYTMALNMPNLTSGSGSWIIRFAELDEHAPKGDLTAPVATTKVDPAYPAEMIRENVEGTVTLYAVIRADGTVGEVRVLQGVNDRLDENARIALLRWRFRPATKNGNAVDLEAVVMIPFRTRRITF